MKHRFSQRLQEALTAGETVITPNNRMARTLIRTHDVACRSAGVRVWRTAQVLPLHSWIETLWRLLSAAAPLPRYLDVRSSRLLWARVVERGQDAGETALYATDGAAALAQEAWSLLHGWRAAGDRQPWRGWQQPEGALSTDVIRFARWAERYQRELERSGLIDDALRPDWIADHAAQLRGLLPLSLLLTGFDEMTPQTTRLLAALRMTGVRIDESPSLPDLARENEETYRQTSSVAHYPAANAQEELRMALSWGWRRLHDSASGMDGSLPAEMPSVAIVVPALSAQLRDVRWLVEDCLPDPALCNISLGTPLLEKPLVHTALELLALIDQPLPMGRAAALLRSPYLPGDMAMRSRRAALERRWISGGFHEAGWRDVLHGLMKTDPALYRRWLKINHKENMLPSKAAAGEWPRLLLQWWQALGWPGSQALNSLDYQASEAWLHCLEKLPSLAAVTPQLSRRALHQILRRWAAETLFQPEGSTAPIQILGTLEAAGLPFDALWVTGLDSAAWPPAAEPHPLLPLNWQRARQMPRATAADALVYAGQLQKQWPQMAPEVVLSYPRERDGQPGTPAALLTALPVLAVSPARLPGRGEKQQDDAQKEATLSPELWQDAQAPAVAAMATAAQEGATERIHHGSSVLAQQSDCPFKAFASARLRVRIWPQSYEGISPVERGVLVHAVLEKLWQRWQTQAALLALDDAMLDQQLEEVYQDVVTEGIAITPARWQNLPAAVASMEGVHVTALLRAWCAIEKRRVPFTVAEREVPLTLELAGMSFTLQADRIDRVDGGVVLIDYKTGRPVSTQHWFDERPQSVQLGVYALAWQASSKGNSENAAADQPTGEPIRALVYAHLREGAVAARGVSEDEALWPQLDSVARFGFDSMRDAQERWHVLLRGLTEAFLAGDARVAPRNPQVCAWCGLQALCRIGEQASEGAAGAMEGVATDAAADAGGDDD